MNALITTTSKHLDIVISTVRTSMNYAVRATQNRIDSFEKLLGTYDPGRQLSLGYSIIHSGKSIIRKLDQVRAGGIL